MDIVEIAPLQTSLFDAEPGRQVGSPDRQRNSQPTSPSKPSVTARVEKAHGINGLPAGPKALLDEWHEKKGNRHPPCTYTHYRRSKQYSRMYDRSGQALKFAELTIQSPCVYEVLVVQFPDNTDKLLVSAFTTGGTHGSCFRAWRGVQDGFEAQTCAIRVFGNTLEEAAYQPDKWHRFDERERRETVKSTSAQTASSSVSSRKRKRPSPAGYAETSQLRRLSGRSIKIPSSEDEEEEDEDEEEEEEESSSSSEEEVESVQKTLRGRRGKASKSASSTDSTASRLVFKLVCLKSGAPVARLVPLEECKKSKDLFGKARDFYAQLNESTKFKTLLYQVPSQREQHLLFEGNEGEFNLLVELARGVQGNSRKPVTIEIVVPRH